MSRVATFIALGYISPSFLKGQGTHFESSFSQNIADFLL